MADVISNPTGTAPAPTAAIRDVKTAVIPYATPDAARTVGGEAGRLLVALAVASAGCVLGCFAALALGLMGGLLHGLIVAVTVLIGVRSSVSVPERTTSDDAGGGPLRRLLDLVAALGLVAIGVSPLLADQPGARGLRGGLAPAAAGLGFLLLAATTFRHVLLYRTLAGFATANGKPSAGRFAQELAALGWVKAIYEAVWLTCCGAPLLSIAFKVGEGEWAVGAAVAALVGIAGYFLIWIWMMVAHASVATLLAPRRA